MFFGSDGELAWSVDPKTMKQCVINVKDENDVLLTNDHHIQLKNKHLAQELRNKVEQIRRYVQ